MWVRQSKRFDRTLKVSVDSQRIDGIGSRVPDSMVISHQHGC